MMKPRLAMQRRRRPLIARTLLAVGLAAAHLSLGPAYGENIGAISVGAGEDVVTLASEHVRVGVSANIGRIVDFAPVDGDNLLWLNADERGKPVPPPRSSFRDVRRAYRNHGGDKVWPTVQAFWERAFGGAGWPPDGVIDGQPWQIVEQSAHHLVIRSQVHPVLGVHCERELRLDADQPTARITNRLTRVQPSIFPVNIWTITQVRHPRFALLDIAAERAQPASWIDFGNGDKLEGSVRLHDADDAAAALQWTFDHEAPAKLGTLGHWIAGVWDDRVFLQTIDDYDPTAAYPDGSNVQAYANGDYLELELLSPLVHLQPGESLAHTVTWRLLPRDDATAAALIDVLRSHAAGE
ncbi:MAG: DUF4380 domain-containing protein [Phycisphaeraceae bacterium]